MKVDISIADIIGLGSLILGIILVAWQRSYDVGSAVLGFGMGVVIIAMIYEAKMRKNPFVGKKEGK